MRGPSRKAEILAVLAEGPATTGEIASETGITSHLAGAHVLLLFKAGAITREPFGDPRLDKLGRGRKWLWRLPA